MRLIDADALLVKQTNIAKTFARRNAQKTLMGRVMYNTEQSPTIDAIPVEWLKDKKLVLSFDHGMLINWLIREWQKEQEAQDGKNRKMGEDER